MYYVRIFSLSLTVGVHCTHGYNRTGFLIVAYLVLKQDWRYACLLSSCICFVLLFVMYYSI